MIRSNKRIVVNVKGRLTTASPSFSACTSSSEDENDGIICSQKVGKNRTIDLPENLKLLRQSKQKYIEKIDQQVKDIKLSITDAVSNGPVQIEGIKKTRKQRRQSIKKQKLNQDLETEMICEKDSTSSKEESKTNNSLENTVAKENESDCVEPISHVLHRDVKPNEHSYCHFVDEDTVIMILKHPGVLCLKGKILLKSVKGCVEILGWHMKQGSDFEEIYQIGKDALLIETTEPPCCGVGDYSDDIVQHLMAEGCPQDLANELKSSLVPQDVVIICKRLDNRVWSYVDKHFPSLFRPVDSAGGFLHWGCEFIELDKFYFVRISNEMVALAQDIVEKSSVSSGLRPRVIVCGGKYLGKSTLIKYLVNSTLNVCNKVCYLDCDPGQTTFTPSGMVSLLVLSKPLLRPSFLNCQKTYMSHFIGDHSVNSAPSHYGSCVQNLFNLYQQDPELAKLPLFVNTMGWVEGIGLALLCNNIATVNPSHMVQMNTRVFTKRNTFPLTPEYVMSCAHWEEHAETLSYKYVEILSQVNSIDIYLTAAMSRDIAYIAHFANAQPKEGEIVPLRKCKTYKVPWSTVAVYACGAVVANSDIMYVLNGTMVALCKCNREDMVESGFGYPLFLKSMPVCECFGYGIIRGIDTIEKLFYIITALPPSTLAHVNAIIKGHLSCPPILIYEKSSEISNLPYCQRIHELPDSKFGFNLRVLKPKYVKKRIVRKKRV